MSLPVSNHYLANALRDSLDLDQMTLKHHPIGDLILPTGQLVACDPLVCTESKPFNLTLPRGRFPVILSVAKIATDQRVAYAVIRVRQTPAITWKMMTRGEQDPSTLEGDQIFGYPVDAGVGCFMDHSTARALDDRLREEELYYETILEEMEKTYVHTWNWCDLPFGDGNLIAFASGYGDGFYATYAGFDSAGEVCVVVTDFRVAPDDTE